MQVAKENAGVNVAAVKALSSGELKNLLGQCLKMASENKITSANTWGLPLIEHLDDLIKEGDDVDKNTNFQKASVTLDAGVKIYSYRVDSVHTETFKILGGLGRASGPGDDSGDPGDGGLDGENVSPSKRKRRNNELNPEATLEPSLDALNVKKFDLAFAVDPLFHKTSAQFDEGGARGLLLNNLSVYKGCDIVFDSMDVPERAMENLSGGSAAAVGDACIDLSQVQPQLDVIQANATNPGASRISPVLDEILALLGQPPADHALVNEADRFVQRIAEAAGDVRPMQPILTFFPNTTTAGAEAHSPMGVNEGGEEGGSAAPYAPIDDDDYDGADYGGFDGGYGGDDYSDDNENPSDPNRPPGASPMGGTSGQHAHAGSNAHNGGGGHVTLNTSLDDDAIQWLISAGNGAGRGAVTGAKGWAGASHWRYKSVLQQQQQSLSGVDGGEGGDEEVSGPLGGVGNKKRGGGSRRKNDPLDFVALMQQGTTEPTFEMLPKTANKAKKTKAVAQNTLLPEDHHYQPEMLARYALRPRNGISVIGGGSSNNRGGYAENEGGYGGDAHHDEGDFGDFGDGGFGGVMSDDDDGVDAYGGGPDWDAFGFGDASGPAAQGLQLVEAARKVEKVDVNYSKAAKQVDVRSLKELMWGGIQQIIQEQGGAVAAHGTELDLNDVLKTVPERNSAGRLEDLSVHLCFICVLHLANEHGLVVKGVPELDRLMISHVPEM